MVWLVEVSLRVSLSFSCVIVLEFCGFGLRCYFCCLFTLLWVCSVGRFVLIPWFDVLFWGLFAVFIIWCKVLVGRLRFACCFCDDCCLTACASCLCYLVVLLFGLLKLDFVACCCIVFWTLCVNLVLYLLWFRWIVGLFGWFAMFCFIWWWVLSVWLLGFIVFSDGFAGIWGLRVCLCFLLIVMIVCVLFCYCWFCCCL